MESVLIIARRDYEVELKRRLELLGPVTTGAGSTLSISDGASRVYVARNDSVRDELEAEELGFVLSLIANPVFYTIDYADILLCKRVLQAIADDPELMVDNDHGVVLPGPEFVQLLRSSSDWDWRKE